MANLTDEHIRVVFDLFDADGSGYIDTDDLGMCLQSLGFGSMSHEDIDALVSEVVVDGSTRIEFPDFRKLVKSHMAVRDSAQEVSKAFRLFDKGGKGKVDANDFAAVCKDIGLIYEGMPPEQEASVKKTIKEIIREANAIVTPAAKPAETTAAPAAAAPAKETPAEKPSSSSAPSINTTQWSKMMQIAVTDKRHKIDESAYSLKTRARVAKKGPFGVKVEAGKTYYWCSCGMSKTQPYCDGSHNALNREQETKYAPVKYVADESRTVWFCGCKQTKTPPFCDGSHTAL